MKAHIIEATVGRSLWSTFLVGRFDHERERTSVVDEGAKLLRFDPRDVLVLDIYTQEGAIFSYRGYARYDIRKHAIWTGPLFESFLNWLRGQFEQGVSFEDLPEHVELPASEAADSERHEGPMTELLKTCLRSTDKEVATAARTVWRATYGSLPPGIPLTLADVQQWLGDPSIVQPR